MYLPKSKYSIKYTNGGLLATISDNVEYIGKYIQTSNNKFIKGTSLNGALLKLLEDASVNMDRNQRALQYNSATEGRDIYNILKQKRNIPSSKPQPTEKDYIKGSFNRYYLYKNNEPNLIYETSKNYFSEYIDSKLDTKLYTTNSVIWRLKGEDAVVANESLLLVLQQENIYINSLFSKPDEYVEFEEDKSLLNKLKNPNQMLDEIPTFTLEQWNMFNSLDKEKLIIKYGEVNISELGENNINSTPPSNTPSIGGGSSGGGGGGY